MMNGIGKIKDKMKRMGKRPNVKAQSSDKTISNFKVQSSISSRFKNLKFACPPKGRILAFEI